MKGINSTKDDLFSKIPLSKTLIITKKTLKDIHSPLKFISAEILFIFIPVILTVFTEFEFGNASPYEAATFLGITLVFIFYIWTLGLVYTTLISTSGAPLISEEVNSGTLLILISKPITRINIFIGKFLALIIYGTVLSFIALLGIGWVITLITSGNIAHFIEFIPFLTAMFVYSVFLLFLFGSIAMALSSVFTKPRMATVSTVLLIMFSYLGFLIIRILPGSFYSDLQLYHFDLGYHLGNIFVFFIETFNALPSTIIWQNAFADFGGIFVVQRLIDPDQGIDLGGYPKTNYYHPIASLLIWLGIAAILLIFGLIRLKKREISV